MKDLSENKHLSEEQIAEIADAINSGDLSSIAQVYLDHIKECDQCADEAMLISEVSEMPDIGRMPSKTSTNRSIKIFAAFAASIALILASYYIFIKPESNNSNIAESTDNIDTIKKAVDVKDEAIAEIDTIVKTPDEELKNKIINQNKIQEEIERNQNQYAFSENKELENLFQRFNSAPMRNGEFKIISDSILKIEPKDSIHIEWEDSYLSYSIQIIDNQGNKIISKDNLITNYKSKSTLDAGLFYWKLLDEDYNLVYCGKILVGEVE
jgi:hypothetical protein